MRKEEREREDLSDDKCSVFLKVPCIRGFSPWFFYLVTCVHVARHMWQRKSVPSFFLEEETRIFIIPLDSWFQNLHSVTR